CMRGRAPCRRGRCPQSASPFAPRQRRRNALIARRERTYPSGRMRVTFVTSGLEHLGVAALSAYVRAHGHEPTLVYEPKPFSSNSGPDNALLARLLEPRPEETAARVLATAPDVVAFSSYTITHQWSVEVARAIKRERPVPIVFGGPHVSGAPAHSIREPAIDVVVEGEGEGALLDLLECAEEDRFGRNDVPNTWVRGPL